ncbi:integrase [Tanacetum coccineum]
MIEPFLITNNLMGYVDGSIPCPSKTLSVTDDATVPKENPNYPIWVSNDAHVRMLIISTISEASFRHVQGTTSRDLWLSLKKAYAPHSTSREYTLKTQLLRIEMHGDETPDAYLNRAQEYADALAAIGEPVKDKDLVMLVVSGLREEYNGLKTTITARQSPTAFSELHALLSDHDYMLEKTRTPIAPYGPQAFYGARPSNNNRSNNNNNRGNRNNSRGNNNRGRDNGRQFDWASTQNTVYGTCNRCGIGHIPSQCPNRDPSTIRTRPSANFANTRAQSSNASANWHSDTGANSHVTPDLEAMDNSEAYYGDDALHVGNDESTHTTLLTGPNKHGLYTITLPQLKSINKVSFSAVRASPTIWHRRLGHPHQRLLHSMLSNFSLPVTNKSLSSFSNSCPLGKSSKLPLFESGFRSNNILDLVYCDVWGPAPLLSFEGHRYFMFPSSSRSPISFPSSVSHLSLTSQTYPESSNSQPSPISTTSIPTPPPPTPPPPPPITRQRPANLHQNPKQRVPYNPSANHATVLPTAITEPTSFTVANNSLKWLPRASTTNVVDGKWVYKLKRDKNGAIIHYKARFVAKGCRQQPCIDFHETFSPVVKSITIRVILSLAVTNDWPLRQLDIQNAFLYGNLKEQALRAWFERLSKALFDLGNNKGTIDNIICQLGSAFTLKDLGPLNYFLGIEIVSHVSGILLFQKKYILELLQSAGLSNCNPVSSPMVTSSSLSLDDSTAFSNLVKYRQVVGSLQYVTLSRPDIAFAVNKVIPILLLKLSQMLTGLKIQMIDGPRGGFAIYLGSNLISWTTRKQPTISRSSTEAEYKALADTVAELTWLQALLHELGIRSSSTPILWFDNLGATYLPAKPIFCACTKHVEIDYHFIREKVAQ